MPDGSRWDVPAEIVAHRIAVHYVSIGSDGKTEEWYKNRFDAEFSEAMKDKELLVEWAEGNMNWEDVESHAVIAQGPDVEPDYQEGWVNGEKEIVSHE